MAVTAQISWLPGQNLKKTLESIQGKVKNAVVNATDMSLPDWCSLRPDDGDMGKWRNQNLKNQSIVLNAGEELVSDLGNLQGTWRVYVMDDDSVSKETRLINPGDGKFVNPVFECYDTPILPSVVNVVIRPGKWTPCLNKIIDWRKNDPGSCETDYYEALEHLQAGRLELFNARAQSFLFRTGDKHGAAATMMRYYLGYSHLSDPNKAAGWFVSALEAEPLLAEVWCGLGDCFKRSKQPEKAIRMYKNAVIMGKMRPVDDELPVILKMYEEYPLSMIEFLGGVKTMT